MIENGALRRTIFALLIIAFLSTGFGLSTHGAMEMDGEMVDCPFMPGAFICTMTSLDMIAASQYLYALPTLKNGFLALFASVAALALVLLWRPLQYPRPSPVRFAAPRTPERQWFRNPLMEAFSAGILNPKAY